MKKENDDYLVNKYPKIFKDRYGDMKQTAMCWGFECGDGWFWIIDNLCGCIQSYIDSNSKKTRIKNKYVRFFIGLLWSLRKKMIWSKIHIIRMLSKYLSYDMINKLGNKFKKENYESIPQVVTTQVKEKFGTLRFYFDGGDDLIDGMVWLAEHMSYQCCEKCGSTENIGQTSGWITTLCEKCGQSNPNWKKYDAPEK